MKMREFRWKRKRERDLLLLMLALRYRFSLYGDGRVKREEDGINEKMRETKNGSNE